LAGIHPNQKETNSYTESSTTFAGAPGILGLTYQQHATTSLPTFLGAQIDTMFTEPNGFTVQPFLRGAWVHEFEPNRIVVPSFNAAPGFFFSIEGARPSGEAARIDAGAKIGVDRHLSFFGNFEGEFSARTQTYGAIGGVKFGW
jgi:subtilase-type serine protease